MSVFPPTEIAIPDDPQAYSISTASIVRFALSDSGTLVTSIPEEQDEGRGALLSRGQAANVAVGDPVTETRVQHQTIEGL